jgi:putative PEP-CTERM system TPR-repeat lipoprotein
MKKIVIAGLAVIVIGGGGAAAWWQFGRSHDPLSNAKAFLEKGDSRSAMIELRNAVRTDPANPEGHLRLGMLQLQSGDAVAAEKELKAARDNGARNPELGVLIAQTYLQQGRNKDMLAEFRPPAPTPELTSQLLILRSFAQVANKEPDAAKSSMNEAETLAPNSSNPPLAAARMALVANDLETAQQKVTRSLQLDPKRPDALLLKGQILNARKDLNGALEALDAALVLAPKYAVARLERANIRLELGRDADAKADVDIILAAQPNSAGGTYLQGVLMTRAHDDAGADAAFQKLSNVLIRYPRVYYFMAVVKYNLGQVEQATDAVTRYVQRYPADPEGVKLLARILLSSGRVDRAVEAMSSSVKAGVADADMLDLLGRAYAISGRGIQAVQSFGQASSMAPDNVDILSRLAAARLGTGDAPGAAGDLQRSLALQPGRANTAEALVVAAMAAGDIEQASKALATLQSQAGDTEDVGLLNATLLMRQQNLPGARIQLDALIKAYPNQPRAKIQLAQVLQLQGQHVEAERILSEVVKQDPTNSAALSGLLRMLLADNRLKETVAILETAYTASPTSEALLLALCDLYVRAGMPEKSIQLLDKAQKAAPVNTLSPSVQVARARAQMALNQPQEAMASFRRLLTQVPGNMQVVRPLVAMQVDAKDWGGARATLREAMQMRPNDVDLMRLLVGVERTAGGDAGARSAIARLQADSASREGARVLSPDFDMLTGRYKEAAAGYARLLQGSPSTALVLNAASSYEAAGMRDAADALLREWLTQQPQDVDAARTLASLDILSRKYDEAQILLEKVVEMRPSDAQALNNLAWLYQRRSDPRALATARRAFLLQPNSQSADTLGWILTSQGKAADGLVLLRQSAADLKSDANAQFHYAAALKETGQRDEAAAILRILAAQSEPFDEQAAARKMLSEL